MWGWAVSLSWEIIPEHDNDNFLCARYYRSEHQMNLRVSLRIFIESHFYFIMGSVSDERGYAGLKVMMGGSFFRTFS